MLKLKLIQSTYLFMWALVRIGATSIFTACASIEENFWKQVLSVHQPGQSQHKKERADKNPTTKIHKG